MHRRMARFATALALAALAVGAPQAAAAIVTLKPDPTAGKDAMIVDGMLDGTDLSTTNFGTSADLIGNFTDNLRAVGLIEFNLADVPVGSTIHSATLSLFHRFNANRDFQYDLFRVTASWGEDTVTFDTAPGIDSSVSYGLTIPDDGSYVYRDWSVTGLVQQWVDGTHANHGMWIEEMPIGGDATAIFASSDNRKEFRPYLTVDYTPPVVPEPGSLAIWWLLGGLAIVAVRRRRLRPV